MEHKSHHVHASITSTLRLSYSVILSEPEVIGTWSSCLIDKQSANSRVDWYDCTELVSHSIYLIPCVDRQDNEPLTVVFILE